MNETEKPVEQMTFFEGMAHGLGWTIAHIIVCIFLGGLLSSIRAIAPAGLVLLGSLLFIGVVQLIYVVPLCIRLKRRGEWSAMKGHITFAAVVALLNAACWVSAQGARFAG